MVAPENACMSFADLRAPAGLEDLSALPGDKKGLSYLPALLPHPGL